VLTHLSILVTAPPAPAVHNLGVVTFSRRRRTRQHSSGVSAEGGGALRASHIDPTPYKHRTTHGPTDGPSTVRKHRTAPQNTAPHP